MATRCNPMTDTVIRAYQKDYSMGVSQWLASPGEFLMVDDVHVDDERVQCQYCEQWGKKNSACDFCGAPID